MDDTQKTEAEGTDPEQYVSADDPSYDGFRLQEFWIATAVGADNQEAVLQVDPLSATIFDLLPGFAIAADKRRESRLRRYIKWVLEDSPPDITEIKIRHFRATGKDRTIKKPEEAREATPE